MTVELPTEYEQLPNDLVAGGAFAAADEAIKHAVHLLAAEQRGHGTGAIDRLPETSDVDELAEEQHVSTFSASWPGPVDAWPEDQSVDDFLAFVSRSRQDGQRSGASR